GVNLDELYLPLVLLRKLVDNRFHDPAWPAPVGVEVDQDWAVRLHDLFLELVSLYLQDSLGHSLKIRPLFLAYNFASANSWSQPFMAGEVVANDSKESVLKRSASVVVLVGPPAGSIVTKDPDCSEERASSLKHKRCANWDTIGPLTLVLGWLDSIEQQS